MTGDLQNHRFGDAGRRRLRTAILRSWNSKFGTPAPRQAWSQLSRKFLTGLEPRPNSCSLSFAPPGTYTIAVETAGFKKYEKSNVVLQANEKLAIGSIALHVGDMAESVEVSAQVQRLQTESGERSASLSSKQINNIAINGRSYLPLVALVPGITSWPDLQVAGHGGIGSITANGARSNQNNLTLDGIGNVDTGNNGDQLATVSVDSVQEFRVLTANYQAEYGRSAG